jgi:hypothetical protein
MSRQSGRAFALADDSLGLTKGTWEMNADPTTQNDVVVSVQRQWNDWRSATYWLSDVSDLHWSRMSGGVFAPAPQPFVHGYVWCNGMIHGELSHSCSHGPGPHRIKVCITKSSNREIWPIIQSLVGPKPTSRR